MEDSRGSEYQSLLLAELAQLKELVIMQVEIASLDQHSPVKSLAPKMLSSVEKLIHMVELSNPEGDQQKLIAFPNTGGHHSVLHHPAAKESLFIENSGSVFDQSCSNLSRKRKTVLPKWKVEKNVGSAAGGIAAALDDGYSWRKYGNKNILGAKHTRGYYRCKDRNSNGCLATKQVQQSDDDPQVFDVIYHGIHTCHQSFHVASTVPAACITKQDQQQNQQPIHEEEYDNHMQQQQQPKQEEVLLDFQAEVVVTAKTEAAMGSDAHDQSSDLSFSLTGPKPPAMTGMMIPTDNYFNISSSSESTYIPASPSHLRFSQAAGHDLDFMFLEFDAEFTPSF